MDDEQDLSIDGLAEASSSFTSKSEPNASLTPKYIVAIGASAGGLDPLQIFFDVMDEASGMAFVVVQHLSPDYKSLMVELLARHTDMTIHRVTDRMQLEPNSIYLIPAGKEMIISNHRLLLSDRDEGSHLHLPIDTFIRSLAEEKGEDAIAIILSGSGSDGCRGAQAVRNAGGFVLVQAPETAKFDGMPNAAIKNKSADLVIAPSDMPAILKRHISGERLRIEAEGDPVTVLDPLRQILDMLRKRFGPDFGYYKDSTVGRRIKRRAGLKRIPELIDYVQLLKDNGEELEALYHDLLIGVTAFFRDQEAFNSLEQLVIPQLGGEMGADRPLRIWIPACATGEEAYSIAILFAEHAERAGVPFNIKIFATDIHDGSLQVAGEGVYRKEMLTGISDERLRTYFEELPNGAYKIASRIRRSVVFSKHNILRDPPFTKMDLISCRNLLIYFTDIAQRKVLSLFHFALRRGAFLFLGSSETVAKLESELEPVDSKQRIYTKMRDVRLPDAIQLLPVSTGREPTASALHVSEARSRSQHIRQVQAGYDLLLKDYAPPSLLVDSNGDVLHVFGNAAQFMRLPSAGLISNRAVDLVRSEFVLVLGPALERTLRHGIRAASQDIVVVSEAQGPYPGTFGDKETIVSLVVEPLKSPAEPRPYFALVKFESKERADQPTMLLPPPDDDEVVIDDEAIQARLREMEHQLKSTEENLQTTIEELETSNEELQAANEELQASNEELQSTNEELHSVNEELHTVSSEHESKISELSQVNQDVDNLLRSTDIGTVFVDPQMRIRKFTPAAANILNLVDHDLGRMIDHVTYRFDDADFYDLVSQACAGREAVEREVQVEDHGWYLLRIRPYRQDGKDLDGAVITFVDINEVRDSRESALLAQQRMESFLFAATDWLWETDKRNHITFVTDGVRQLGLEPDEALGRPFWEVFGGDLNGDEYWQMQMAGMNAHTSFRGFEVAMTAPGRNTAHLSISGTPLLDTHGNFTGFRGTVQDITERHETDLRLSQAESRYRIMYNSAPVLMHSTDRQGHIISVSDFWLSRMGYERSEVIGQQIDRFYATESEGCSTFVLDELADGRRLDSLTCSIKPKQGRAFQALLWAVPEFDQSGNLSRTLEVLVDVSELRQTTADLAAKNSALTEANRELERFNYVASHDLRSPLRSCNIVLQHLIDDLDGLVEPALRDQFRLINDRLIQMEAMLGDLLNFAQASRDDLELARLPLQPIIDEALNIIQLPAGFNADIDVQDLMIDTNASMASHVFRNLIENVLVHHDRDHGQISIVARTVTGGIEVDVADDGPGIDPRYHEKIFELFGRVSSDKPGDGLGLALAKRALAKTGGTISLQSATGQRGCLFRLYWPNDLDLEKKR